MAFVVFQTVEQRDAALVDVWMCWALLGTGLQLENKMIIIEAKDPERNTALEKREAEQAGGNKRLRKEVAALSKHLGRKCLGAASSSGSESDNTASRTPG